MKTHPLQLAIACFALLTVNAPAAMLYVDLNSASPTSPYTNWTTAAHNLQDAVVAAQAGDTVLVTNGIYTVGGAVVYGTEINRVALTNAILLLSVNGPQATRIVGETQTRGVYVGSNAILSGFTVTNGHASTSGDYTNEMCGGGIWCEPSGVVTNCVITGNSIDVSSLIIFVTGGGMYGGAASNCTIVANTGEGASHATLVNCTVSGNAGNGALQSTLINCLVVSNSCGAEQCTLYHCTLTGNGAYYEGGGADESILYDCSLSGNYSYMGGGGANSCILYNCCVTNNRAHYAGGGVYNGTNYNCLIVGNLADDYGGGAYFSSTAGRLYNCTVSGNKAVGETTGFIGQCGGVMGGTLYNCIVYDNYARTDPNWSVGNGQILYRCCTFPQTGSYCITNDPLFVDGTGGDCRLKCGSPCIDTGLTNTYIFATTNDIRDVLRPFDGNDDGIAGYDIGAYEFNPDVDSTVGIRAEFTNFAASYPVTFAAQAGGCPDSFWLDFGDGTVVSNQYLTSHTWTSPGQYAVQLFAYYPNLSQALTATVQVQVVAQPVYYANVSNLNYHLPYTNWAWAARDIQQAIAAGSTPGRLILVTNGVYRTSGVLVNGHIYNMLALTNAVLVRSVHGPGATQIWPNQGRCAYVGANGILSGFTLTNGVTLTAWDVYYDQSGGGIWCEPGAVVTNCVITGNQANINGGGAYQGAFYNCIFTNNSVGFGGAASPQGGGAFGATLYYSTIISNTAPNGNGGGVAQSTLYNCTVSGNSANYQSGGTGGGAIGSTLYGCTLSGNKAFQGGGAYSDTMYSCFLAGNRAYIEGGGADMSTLYNSVLFGNQASYAGGAFLSTIYNCTVVSNSYGGIYSIAALPAYNSIIYFNNAANGNPANWLNSSSSARNCCTIPLPAGSLNTTNDPMFVNVAAGDLRLHFGSPCIDAGTNLSAFITNDIAGNPRPLDGNGDGVAQFDMGAYEFNLLATVGTNWLLSFGLNPDDPLVFTSHPNGHPLSVLQSWVADLNPTNPESLFLILAVSKGPPVTVSFSNSSSRVYTLFANTNLAPGWLPVPGQANVPGIGGVMTLQDTYTLPNNFYRVGVSLP